MRIITEDVTEEEADIQAAADMLASGLDPDLGPKPGYSDEEYSDYDRNNSRVLSGPIGKASFSGTRYQNWREASQATRHRFYLIKFWVCGHRWFARVRVGPDGVLLHRNHR